MPVGLSHVDLTVEDTYGEVLTFEEGKEVDSLFKNGISPMVIDKAKTI